MCSFEIPRELLQSGQLSSTMLVGVGRQKPCERSIAITRPRTPLSPSSPLPRHPSHPTKKDKEMGKQPEKLPTNFKVVATVSLVR